MVMGILCRRLQEGTSLSRHQLRVWIGFVGVISMWLIQFSTALTFLTNMSVKRKSASPSAIKVKNKRKAISIEEKLRLQMQREKGEQIVDICHNVRLAHSIIHKICDKADRIKESAKSGTKVFV
jgi:hypothetical protein